MVALDALPTDRRPPMGGADGWARAGFASEAADPHERGRSPLRTSIWAGLVLFGVMPAAPALAQNAAAMPVSAVVLEAPAIRTLEGLVVPHAWLVTGGNHQQDRAPGRRVLVGGGLAAMVVETIEPDRVRVRLEYIAN